MLLHGFNHIPLGHTSRSRGKSGLLPGFDRDGVVSLKDIIVGGIESTEAELCVKFDRLLGMYIGGEGKDLPRNWLGRL